jgi:hypothetical protein
MSAAPINGHGKPEPSSPADSAVDRRIIARMEELREQGFSFGDIAAVLARQGLTLSPERVKEILDAHRVSQWKK